MTAILSLDALSVELPVGADRQLALDGVSLQVRSNEIVCLVGESGSGKSMTASAAMGLLPAGTRIACGTLAIEGVDFSRADNKEWRKLRGARIGMIFQEPMTALNPIQTIGRQVAEVLREHTSMSRSERAARVLALLEEVRLPNPRAIVRAYPHQLSGGQRQRVVIAMALALEPVLLIADEPTTALDVTTQAQVLRLIRDLQRRRGTAVLFITHDFGVVAEIADRIAVMQHGRIVETGSAEQVLNAPQHAYTRALIAAVPTLAPQLARPPQALQPPGEPALALQAVAKTFRSGSRWTGNLRSTQALRSIDLELERGRTLGIVGESGSGKTTLARCVVGLSRPDGGTITVDGQRIGGLPGARGWGRHGHGARVQMVFQDPYSSLDPRRRVGDLVAQGPIVHGMPRAQAHALTRDLFALVGLDPDSVQRYAHQFSGGQRQRIGLARALALKPSVLVADEPVSALDVSVQGQVLDLLTRLRDEIGLSILFITHDLRVAAQVCDRVAVMSKGEVVETGETARVFADPRHPYTRALLDAIPGRAWEARLQRRPLPEQPGTNGSSSSPIFRTQPA